jgi:hypothetical protein
MKSSLIRSALLVIPMFVAACGGGGGGGTPAASAGRDTAGGAPWGTATALAVTTSNAPALAAEAMEVATNTDAADAGGLSPVGVEISGTGGIAGTGPKRLADAARKLLAKAQGSGTLVTGVAAQQACSLGGTLTVDGSSSGSAVLSAGFWAEMIASNCTEGDGVDNVVMNGRIKMSVVSGSYDPASTVYPKSFTMRIETTNFTVSGGGESEKFNGDLTVAFTETSEFAGSIAMTANSLTSEIGSHTVFMSNYSLSVQEDGSSSTMTITASVQTDNSRLGSSPVSYSITTVTPLTVSSTGVVSAGSIKVTGAGSTLLLTVTDSDTFSLQVDTNGDGSYDDTSTVTRSQLQALI